MAATVYSDGFSGTGSLGNVESGNGVWKEVNGVWTRTNGYASTTTAASANPIAVIDAKVSDVDIVLNISSVGGDTIYFRVTDAQNWMRVRLYEYTTSSSSQVVDHYDVSAWSVSYSTCLPQSGNPPGDSYSNYEYGYATVWWHVTSSTCTVTSPAGPGYNATKYTRTVTPVYTTQTTYTYHYQVITEKCVAGTVTNLATYSLGTGSISQMRAVANKDAISVYSGTSTLLNSISDSTFLNVNNHGIGKGGSPDRSGSALDNFQMTLLREPNLVSGWGPVPIF